MLIIVEMMISENKMKQCCFALSTCQLLLLQKLVDEYLYLYKYIYNNIYVFIMSKKIHVRKKGTAYEIKRPKSYEISAHLKKSVLHP